MNLPDRISILKGDITKIGADAIVNAANSSLMGGGGVDGAIHRAGGPKILEECQAIIARRGLCRTGEAVITSAGNLPARYIIHTVGPVWNNGNHQEAELLRSCYLNSLELAVKHGINIISFPCISTGAYRYPAEEAAAIALKAISGFLKDKDVVKKVLIICFDDGNLEIYNRLLRNLTA